MEIYNSNEERRKIRTSDSEIQVKNKIFVFSAKIHKIIINSSLLIVITVCKGENRNLYCIDIEGNFKWQIPKSKYDYKNSKNTGNYSHYVSAEFLEKKIRAFNFSGYYVDVDIETGEIFNEQITK